MTRTTLALVPALALFLVACGSPEEPAPTPEPPAVVVVKPKPYQRPKLQLHSLTETLYYPLDTCVVSGKKLPLTAHNEEVEGRLVRTYNETYIAKVKADPQTYFAKLDQAYKDQQRGTYPLDVCCVTNEPLGEAPYEFLIDPRADYTLALSYAQRYLPYRYTLPWRLVRVKDAEAAQAFKKVDKMVINADRGVTRDRAYTAEKAMDRINQAMMKPQFDSYPVKFCAVNGLPNGRWQEDSETGGYRRFLLHTRLFVVC